MFKKGKVGQRKKMGMNHRLVRLSDLGTTHHANAKVTQIRPAFTEASGGIPRVSAALKDKKKC